MQAKIDALTKIRNQIDILRSDETDTEIRRLLTAAYLVLTTAINALKKLAKS